MSSTDKSPKQDVTIACPDCGSTDLVVDFSRGETICRNCGMVVEENLIDDRQEWRAYSADERDSRSRVGSPTTILLHDKGLSTTIGTENRDIFGRKLSSKQANRFYRLRKHNARSRIHSSTDRNLTKAMRELDRIASQLSLPKSVKETASIIYRDALRNNLIRGRSIEEMVAASIYASCRQRHLPRTLEEVASHSKISKKELGRAYRLLLERLKLKIPLADPINYINRYASELELSGAVAQAAREIINQARSMRLAMGKDPVSLAAASIYIAGILHGEQLTQQGIAKVVGVTEVTIRNRYKELVQKLQISNQDMM